jgi:hypothetical protein
MELQRGSCVHPHPIGSQPEFIPFWRLKWADIGP